MWQMESVLIENMLKLLGSFVTIHCIFNVSVFVCSFQIDNFHGGVIKILVPDFVFLVES